MTAPAADPRVEEYRSAVLACALVASMLVQHDLEAILEAIAKGHAAGPIIDPTLYREKMGAMQEDENLVRAALPLWRLGQKLAERAEASHVHVYLKSSTGDGEATS